MEAQGVHLVDPRIDAIADGNVDELYVRPCKVDSRND